METKITQEEQAMIDRIVQSVALGLGQDERKVRYLVESAYSAQSGTAEQPKIRWVYHAEKGTGRRVSKARVVTKVGASTNGYAFGSDWLSDDRQYEHPLGSVIVEQHPVGSAMQGLVWRVGRLNDSGEIDWGLDIGNLSWAQRRNMGFLDFKDRVAEMIAG